MRRLSILAGIVALLAVTSAEKPMRSETVKNTPVCCDAAEMKTIRDLNFVVRRDLKPPKVIFDRLLNMAYQLSEGKEWTDPDRGYILGLMASTPDGRYWRGLLDEYAATLHVTIKDDATLPSSTTTPVPPASSSLLGLNTPVSGMLEFRSAPKENQFGIPESFYAVCNANDTDGAFRCHQNWAFRGTRKLPISVDGFDSRGSWSYNWFPASEPLNGVQESPDMGAFDAPAGSELYKAYRGQTLVIDGGGQKAYDYASGVPLYERRGVLIASQREGWPMWFAVSWNRTNGVQNRAAFGIMSTGEANPIRAVIDGELRTLKGCKIGNINVVCY